MNLEFYKDKGLTGLANLGNTCYLNSCIQIFSHTYELTELFKKISQERTLNNIQDSLLLLEWNKLLNLMWSKNCTVAPYGFLQEIQTVSEFKGRELFMGFAQNDMPEFLIFLIDCFHNSLEREVNIKISGVPQNNNDKIAKVCYKMMQDMYSKNYSELLNLFYGIQVSKISNINKEIRSITAEPFSILNLPIPLKEDKQNPDSFIEYKKTDQTRSILGCRTCINFSDKKRVVHSLLASIIGRHMSYRMFLNIREILGFAYYISA